jgi:arabinose operon protein AraL
MKELYLRNAKRNCGKIYPEVTMFIDQVQGFIFDLDGTVYLGEAALPGAVETIAELRQLGKRMVFVSNKPLEPRRVYAEKLTRLGIPTHADAVITAAFVLGRHLAQHYPSLNYYVIGEQNLKDELRDHKLQLVGELDGQDEKLVINPAGIDAVIVAFDRTLNYRKLNTAYQALKQGARFMATNSDSACPMPGGDIPDAGATIAALEHLTGRRLELLAGKPSTLILQVALDCLGLEAAQCMLVGDRLETDIRMAKQAGMWAAVTLTGVSGREDVALANPAPDFVIENLAGLFSL